MQNIVFRFVQMVQSASWCGGWAYSRRQLAEHQKTTDKGLTQRYAEADKHTNTYKQICENAGKTDGRAGGRRSTHRGAEKRMDDPMHASQPANRAQ